LAYEQTPNCTFTIPFFCYCFLFPLACFDPFAVSGKDRKLSPTKDSFQNNMGRVDGVRFGEERFMVVAHPLSINMAV